MELSICILASKCPLDSSTLGVSAPLPSGYFGAEGGSIRQSLTEALAVQDADFDLRHVEPTCVLRCVVEFDSSQQGSCRSGPEHVHEAFAKVRIEVVQDEMDAVSAVINVFEEVTREGNKVHLGTVIGDSDGAPARLGFDRHEQVAGARALVLVVLLGARAGLSRQAATRILEQLLALFVHTHHRLPGAQRPGIQIEQIIHALAVLLGENPDTPHQLAPRFEAVFFSNRRMLSRLIRRICGWRRAACVSNATVQRLAPWGGEEHAKAAICASSCARYRLGWPGRPTSYSA
jgi:hypothetical protein